jgi:hypothetical protein
MWQLPHSVANRRNAATGMVHHSDIGDSRSDPKL